MPFPDGHRARTGAQLLTRSLADAGVSVMFTNPGTTEIDLVTALDDTEGIRGVLCLDEAVATGAADGYARISRRPAVTLLHLGPGLANGLGNLHNARWAGSPVVTIVGDHPHEHRSLGSPLESEIDLLARWSGEWTRRVRGPESIVGDVADAIAAALGPPAGPVTLVVPADVSWSRVHGPGSVDSVHGPSMGRRPAPPSRARIRELAEVLAGGKPSAILLGGPSRDLSAVRAAERISQATGARMLVDVFPTHMIGGRGMPRLERVAYVPDQARRQLSDLEHVIMADARPLVSFFAANGRSSSLLPAAAAVHELTGPGEDSVAALIQLADLVDLSAGGGPSRKPGPAHSARPYDLDAPLTAQTWAHAIAPLLPAGAIISDEAVSASAPLSEALADAAPHELLGLSGLCLGQGLPVAVGAALAAPDRSVIAVQGDGGAQYSLSALWTMARENLDVTVLLLNNSGYETIAAGLREAGAVQNAESWDLVSMDRPRIDFSALASGFGVPAARVRTGAEAMSRFRWAIDEPGPHLLEIML
jgi:acetolactate synthase-1/2/3 large subunit